jgi:hypothetical protein
VKKDDGSLGTTRPERQGHIIDQQVRGVLWRGDDRWPDITGNDPMRDASGAAIGIYYVGY